MARQKLSGSPVSHFHHEGEVDCYVIATSLHHSRSPVLPCTSHTLLLPCLACRIDGLKEHAEKMVTDAQFKAAQHRCVVWGLNHCEEAAFVDRGAEQIRRPDGERCRR